ncbi:MAG: aconitate hydratase 1 [Elusimicrobia bacterium GWA2_69_24]|nr:MAG: aconitate hydratase 1 [Elusimicrobia bacterium GWA2_69_24]
MNSFHARTPLRSGDKTYDIFRIGALAPKFDISRLPFSMRIFLENLLRNEDGRHVSAADVEAAARWSPAMGAAREAAFTPVRVLMQDFTGVPAIVDLAAMRDAVQRMGRDPKSINPLVPVDLVIDHSIQVDRFGAPDAADANTALEFRRNRERYIFLKWGQGAFRNFRVIPPATGICHQVNLEYLARVVWTDKEEGRTLAFPDTLVGTDSHTTMINGLGVLGWGVGGIEAEAAMLGQPLAMVLPEVIGMRLTGKLPEGTTATDAVLTVTQLLRKKGVVGKFVEFYGPGVGALPLADRATIANMAPEYGATVGFFPVDARTLEYLAMTGRPQELIRLVEDYCRAQGVFRTDDTPDPAFTSTLELDLATVKPCIAGPKRPQDRVVLSEAKQAWGAALPELLSRTKGAAPDAAAKVSWNGQDFELRHGSVVIAAITSCTNTSNPSVLIAAGLLAKKAADKGLRARPWVKTSLSPGSKVVLDYLQESGLLPCLEKLGFHHTGFGCMTCIGNSGPLPEPVAQAIAQKNLVVASVLSGNRNFEGRVNPHCRANYLASPPLVVAYALAGRMDIDLAAEPLGTGADGRPVMLADIWPSDHEIAQAVQKTVRKEQFVRQYAAATAGNADWKAIAAPGGERYSWDRESTYIQDPPYFRDFDGRPKTLGDIGGARVLMVLGDSVTTDHISPAGSIPKNGPAGGHLLERGVAVEDFNQFGTRRGNHEVMMRGTFANIRIRNLMLDNVEGGYALHLPDAKQTTVYDAAMQYRAEKTPLLILAGKEYGTGSSRDWAAKGPSLLGVRAVIAESFERIHRSNLVGMGILPLQFAPGHSRGALGLTGEESYDLEGIAAGLRPGMEVRVTATASDGSSKEFRCLLRVDTPAEVEYCRYGGILHYVLSTLKDPAAAPSAQGLTARPGDGGPMAAV